MKIASRTLAGLLAAALPLLTSCISFDSSTVTSNDVADLKLVNRLYVPYGPDLTTDPVQEAGGTVWEGYGFGFGKTISQPVLANMACAACCFAACLHVCLVFYMILLC